MNSCVRFGIPVCLAAGSILLHGCKPNAEQLRLDHLKQFQKQMEQVDASINIGMPYSNLVAKIGEPIFSNTNDGWVMTIYNFEPHVAFHDMITTGFRVDVSNGIVIRKSPITGTRE